MQPNQKARVLRRSSKRTVCTSNLSEHCKGRAEVNRTARVPRSRCAGVSPDASAAVRCKQLRGNIQERLEFEGIAGRVTDKERGLLARCVHEPGAGFDDPIDMVLPESRRQLRPLRRFEYHAAVRYRHGMTVNQVAVGRDAPVAPQLRIEVADELMAEHVEIDPVGRAAALGASENFRVEASCLRDVPHLNGDMKWGKNHGSSPCALAGG